MTTISKKEKRQIALDRLQKWHKEHNITNFPKRLGISTNEKKFREISFRAPRGVELEDAEAEDFIVSTEPVYGWGNEVTARIVTYRVWLPSKDRKIPGTCSIRFSMNMSVVGLVKVGKYFVGVEHDNFPLQRKTIGAARMFGVSDTNDLNELGSLLLEKEFPFFQKYVKRLEVKQLGNTIYQDPTTRREESVFLLIHVFIDHELESKDDLLKIIDHRNKEMILHHVYTEEELKEIFNKQIGKLTLGTVYKEDDFRFRDQFSSWCLASYFITR